MNKKLSIQDIARSTHVDRWQIVRTLRQQNLAEHQYMVTMIALEIARKAMGVHFNAISELDLIRWCMRHDLREVVHGDICTPVKQRIKRQCGKDTFKKIERDICDDCNFAEDNVEGTVLWDIAKLADLIDGIRFLTIEGNGKHAEAVLSKLHTQYLKKSERVAENYTGYNWGCLSHILHNIINDECGYLEFERV